MKYFWNFRLLGICFLLLTSVYIRGADHFLVNHNGTSKKLLPCYLWTCGCGPTAISMALGYWDNYDSSVGGKYSAYGRIIDYYMDEIAIESYTGSDGVNYKWLVYNGDPNQCPTRPKLILDLAEAMNCTGGGSVTDSNVAPGVNNVINGKNYGNSWADLDQFFIWSTLKSDIDANKPLGVGIPNHWVCCWGYSDTDDEFFTYDTWHEYRADYPKDDMEVILQISPDNGHPNEDVDLKAPDGGQVWTGGSHQNISWYQYSGTAIDNVDIYYSTDGGRNFSTVENWVSTSPGWNYYDWTVPNINSSRMRIKINGWDGGTSFLSGDGSQENFTVQQSTTTTTQSTTSTTQSTTSTTQSTTSTTQSTTSTTQSTTSTTQSTTSTTQSTTSTTQSTTSTTQSTTSTTQSTTSTTQSTTSTTGSTTSTTTTSIQCGTIIFQDDFEGTFPGSNWTLYNTPTWGSTTYRSASGSKSVYCGGSSISPPGPYTSNMWAWMEYGPFDLSDAISGEINLKTWVVCERGYDVLYLAVSTNGHGNNYYGSGISTNLPSWQSNKIDLANSPLGNLCGKPAVWFAIIFGSDSSIQLEGAYVDDVVICKDTQSSTTTTTQSTTSTTQSTTSTTQSTTSTTQSTTSTTQSTTTTSINQHDVGISGVVKSKKDGCKLKKGYHSMSFSDILSHIDNGYHFEIRRSNGTVFRTIQSWDIKKKNVKYKSKKNIVIKIKSNGKAAIRDWNYDSFYDGATYWFVEP